MQFATKSYKDFFKTKSTVFTSFEDSFVLNKNEIKDSIFIFFDIAPKIKILLLRDRGDFEGEVIIAWMLKDNKIKEIWNNTGQLTSVEDFDNDGDLEFIFHNFTSEPGSIGDYYFVDYIFYEVFSYENETIKIDSILTEKYNLKYDSNYRKAISMKKPVLISGKNEKPMKYDSLIDFEIYEKVKLNLNKK